MANKEPLPEVQRYITACIEAAEAETQAIDNIEDAHRGAVGKIQAQYPNPLDDGPYSARRAAYTKALRVRSEALNQAWRARRSANGEAWQALKSSADPLVRFIAENCGDYPESASKVLELLPAPLEELDALARRNGWCEVWDQLRDQAVAAGLFGGVKPPSEARKALLTWVESHMDNFGYLTRSGRRQLNELLDAVVREEATA